MARRKRRRKFPIWIFTLIIMTVLLFLIDYKIFFIFYGILFILTITRTLRSIVLELTFVGALLGITDPYHLWFQPAFNLPVIPEGNFFVMLSTMIATWSIIRLIYVSGLWIKPLGKVAFILTGEKPNLKKYR